MELVEQSTGELSFGAGYSTAEGVIGDVSITERNLMGNGQFLRLQLSGSLERLQVNLSFTEPRFLDRNLAAGFDLFHKEVDQTSQSGFRAAVPVAACASASRCPRSCGCRPTTRRRATQIFDVEPDRLGGHPGAEGTSYTSMVGTTLTYDLRNDAKNPTKGLWFQTGADFAGLGGDVQYVSLAAEARGYYPITDNITFVARAIGGSIQGWGGEDVRLIDLFFKGGETVRGFDRAGYGPRDMSTATRSAAQITGRRRRKSASPSRSCPTISASPAPCSPTPARCGMRADAPSELWRLAPNGRRACRTARPSARRSAPA